MIISPLTIKYATVTLVSLTARPITATEPEVMEVFIPIGQKFNALDVTYYRNSHCWDFTVGNKTFYGITNDVVTISSPVKREPKVPKDSQARIKELEARVQELEEKLNKHLTFIPVGWRRYNHHLEFETICYALHCAEQPRNGWFDRFK